MRVILIKYRSFVKLSWAINRYLLPHLPLSWCTVRHHTTDDECYEETVPMKKQSAANIITTLQRSWQASFNFFEPKELRTIVLLSLNTTLRAAVPLAKYFSWWLLLWGCYIDLYVDGNALFGGLWEYARPMYYAIGLAPRLYVMTMLVITFFMMLSVRASLSVKQPVYYLQHIPRLLLFIPLYILVPQIFVMPIFWFIVFFYLDAPYTVKNWGCAIYNGAMLWVANMPFIVIMGALHGVLFHIHRMLWDMTFIEEYHFFAYIVKYSTSMLLYMLFVAMLATIYTRVVSGNSSNPLFKKS